MSCRDCYYASSGLPSNDSFPDHRVLLAPTNPWVPDYLNAVFGLFRRSLWRITLKFIGCNIIWGWTLNIGLVHSLICCPMRTVLAIPSPFVLRFREFDLYLAVSLPLWSLPFIFLVTVFVFIGSPYSYWINVPTRLFEIFCEILNVILLCLSPYFNFTGCHRRFLPIRSIIFARDAVFCANKEWRSIVVSWKGFTV